MSWLQRVGWRPGLPREDHFQDVTISGTLSLAANAVIAPGVNFKDINNIRYANAFGGDDAGEKIVAAIADLPSAGGIVDARGLEGAQKISSTIAIAKPVTLLLGHATFTLSASPSFDFQSGSLSSAIIGVGIGSNATDGTRLIASAGTVTPMIRFKGTFGFPKAGRILLQDLFIEGVYTPTQIGVEMDSANGIWLNRVSFFKLGQAEDINFAQEIHHNEVFYLSCGSGDTAATACVRVENRSNPGTSTEQITWYRGDWQEDGSSEDGMQLFIGNDVTNVWLNQSFLALVASTERVVVIERASNVRFNQTVISSLGAVTAVVDVGGTVAEDSVNIQFYGCHIVSTVSGVPALRLDRTRRYVVNGGLFQGPSDNTVLIQITANAGQGIIGPTQVTTTSGDTLLSDASNLATVFYSTGPSDPERWEASDIIPWEDGKALGADIAGQRWKIFGADVEVDRIWNNTAVTFTDGDTTPDVSGSNSFVEANTSGTTITNFNSSNDLQRITLLFTTANTTISDGANIQLEHNADFTGASNDTIELVVRDTIWREVSRQTQSDAIVGDLNHDGSNVGFYATTPVSQASASAALTGTPGTADGAMATISGSGADSDINNNFQELQDKVNNALAALRGVGLIAT